VMRTPSKSKKTAPNRGLGPASLTTERSKQPPTTTV
jgi:hypothetical protein